MKKIKEFPKSSPIAMVIVGLLLAGAASAAVLTFYGSTQGSATDVQQSVLFGDKTTSQTYEVGNSKPVAGNVYYNLTTLMNQSSDKPAKVTLQTQYFLSGHHGWSSTPEPGITTSYLEWNTPQTIFSGVRPTAVYNSTDSKKYEVWYKTSEGAANLRYAYYDSTWHGANTNVSGTLDAPFVMKEGGKYYMVNYGSSDSKHFDIYTSDNGTSWTDKGTIYTYPGGWYKVDNPKVLKDDNGYKMYFQMKPTNDSNAKYYIFMAETSAKSMEQIAYDAQQGTKDFSIVGGHQYGGSVLAPGAEGEWDSFRVMQPMVFKSGNKKYTMLYTGYDKYDQKGRIGYATSDDGIAWTKVKVSKEGYDTALGINSWRTSVVKTNDHLVLFYQNGSNINKTWLVSAVDSSNQMTLQPQEIKPFFIENDFAINLTPGDYKIKTIVSPVTGE